MLLATMIHVTPGVLGSHSQTYGCVSAQSTLNVTYARLPAGTFAVAVATSLVAEKSPAVSAPRRCRVNSTGSLRSDTRQRLTVLIRSVSPRGKSAARDMFSS